MSESYSMRIGPAKERLGEGEPLDEIPPDLIEAAEDLGEALGGVPASAVITHLANILRKQAAAARLAEEFDVRRGGGFNRAG